MLSYKTKTNYMSDINTTLKKDLSLLFDITKEITGVTCEEIKSRSRINNIKYARMIICEVLRRNSNYKLWEIAKNVCNLDHSTLIHYKSKVVEYCEKDVEFKKNFTLINVKFKNIKDVGYPLKNRLEFAIQERDRLNKEIRKMKKMLNL